MILVDTSVWVDYLRAADTPARARLKQLIRDGAELAVTEPVIMELLAGAERPDRQIRVEQLANGLPVLAIDPRIDFRAAAGLHKAARKSGHTVRNLVDCLIASVALRNDVPLLHKDQDFDVIAAIAPLRTHK